LSPYGVMGLGGNVREWDESSSDLLNSSDSSNRGVRGSRWGDVDSSNLSSSSRFSRSPSGVTDSIGFRVASLPSSAAAVPEPSMMVIGTLFGLGGLMAKRRMKK
jgi:formylglycine-generating enzyme required for sulfatase activity